jgi:ADP-ribose pyrophosphatase YjhB (NUDIX family)
MSVERNIPDCFYRISIKALILNATRDKFLICQEENGKWELPGGGLDWGETPQSDLPRELMEEMGLKATWIADYPAYFFTFTFNNHYGNGANVVFETALENLDFTASDECVAIDWINLQNADQFDLFQNVDLLLKQFDPARHQ